MTTEFETASPDERVGDARNRLSQSSSAFCVIVTELGEPIRIATAEQLQGLTDPLAPLSNALQEFPTAIVVEEEQDIDGIVENLSARLLAEREIRGVVVLSAGAVSGVLPRKQIAEHARLRIRTRGAAGLPGDPLSPAPTYVCPRLDHEEDVESYDPAQPPRCPIHGLILIRKT